MPLTLGMTGMDPATEAALKTAFETANARGGQRWRLLPDTEAEHVVVDMDSMYGPMSWLRLHAAGKHVIGLTSAPRTQTDFHLARPFDAHSLAVLLEAVAKQNSPGDAPADAAAAPAPAAMSPAMSPLAAQPSGMAPAPLPQDQLPEEQPLAVDEEARAPAPAPALPGSVTAGSLAAATIEPAAPVAAQRPPPPRERHLADWLGPDALAGRLRYSSDKGPTLLIDADTRQYHGPALLKPLAGLFDGVVVRGDFKPVDATTWASETAALGAAQPLGRLQWYGGLLAGKGALLPDFDPAGRYKLSKWPQTEREFPKHFRIATAMMKGPAMLDEIASASGVSRQEVIDFVNANLVTGYAEFVPEQPPEPTEPPKPAGLFGRLRGR